MKNIWLLLLAGLAALSGVVNAQSSEDSEDPGYADEILASANYQDGSGRIEIRRSVEDDAAGVLVVRTGLIQSPYRAPFARGLSIADKVALMYRETTGQEIPAKAYRALHEVDLLKAAQQEDPAHFAAFGSVSEMDPRNGCSDKATKSTYFYYDCYVYGPIAVARSGTDDVCLLVAAIKGNVSMQISYKAINDVFYNNFNGTVAKGHFLAAALWTGAKRTRKGKIFNAAASDYSRYSYGGDFKLLGTNYEQLNECQGLAI